jgi:hypothetical protein
MRSIEWRFHFHSLEKKSEAIWRAMTPKVRDQFVDYPGYRQVSMCVMNGPGYGPVEDSRICWETPLGFTVWDQEGPLFALGLEFRQGFLCIRQMQGVPGKRIVSPYRDWPRIFVEIAQEYALEQGLRGVRIYRARTSMCFWYPVFGPVEDREDFARRCREVRARMLRRYDGTAQEIGFVPKKDFWVWHCPSPSARP